MSPHGSSSLSLPFFFYFSLQLHSIALAFHITDWKGFAGYYKHDHRHGLHIIGGPKGTKSLWSELAVGSFWVTREASTTSASRRSCREFVGFLGFATEISFLSCQLLILFSFSCFLW